MVGVNKSSSNNNNNDDDNNNNNNNNNTNLYSTVSRNSTARHNIYN